MKLNPWHQVMVERNLSYAKAEGIDPVVARLRAGGYHAVADEVTRRSA